MEPISKEIQQYKEALKACYASFDASMVSFEVGRTGGKGGHAHIQVRDPSFISTYQVLMKDGGTTDLTDSEFIGRSSRELFP